MLIGPAPDLYAYTGGKPFDARLPTVVFIHGAQLDHSVWILQSRYLAHHGHAVLALDLPGHGRSAGAALPSVEAMADAIAPRLAAITGQPLLLVGHSMGSLIALEIARRLGSRVVGVALLGTAYPMKVSDALLAATRESPEAAIEMIDVWSHSPSVAAFNRAPSAPGPGFSIPGQGRALMRHVARRNGAAVLPTDFAACNAYAGGLDAAAALRCPALFLLGANDQMTPPRAARALREACPDATEIVLPGCGHELMTEAAGPVLEALKHFAARVLRGG
jgi:pimeloyl-ACP methyl ester carboxylesterase